MKQLLQSEFNKGGKTYKNVSSPETSGTQSQVTTIVLDGSVLKISKDNGATFLDIVTTQSNTNANEIDGIQSQISTMLSDIETAVTNISNLTSNTTLIKNANSGFSAGDGATAGSGGAIGASATATSGGAIGSSATADSGGAVGQSATATWGGAIGNSATATWGGAVGSGAKAGNGFSGGFNAKAGTDSNGAYIDAIQLGEGTNNTPKTLQVYDHKVYDSTKDSLYGYYLNDKTPAVIETVWDGRLDNDGSTTITVSTSSQYDYFILWGFVEGRFSNVIPNRNGTYSFVKKSDTALKVNAFSFVYTDGSFTWGQSGFYANGNFTFVDRTGTGDYELYRIEGVKLCKA